jgi:hypothetical protein
MRWITKTSINALLISLSCGLILGCNHNNNNQTELPIQPIPATNNTPIIPQTSPQENETSPKNSTVSSQTALGDRGNSKVSSSNTKIPYYASPQPNSRQIGTTSSGEQAQIIDRVYGADRYTWYRVRFNKSGSIGWVSSQDIKDLDTSSPPTPGSPSSSDIRDDNYLLHKDLLVIGNW